MEEGYGSKSRFNAGVALTERVDALQRAINSSKFNPMMKNPITGTFGFEDMITSLDCLISEGWGKFSSDEKKLILKYKKIMNDLVKYFPPVKMLPNGNVDFNLNNFDKFKDFFEKYELKIKELLDAHDLNAPSSEDDEGL